jgi:hypothetical protein
LRRKAPKEVTEIVKNKKTGKRVILPPSEQDPNAVIERKGPNMRGGQHEYPTWRRAKRYQAKWSHNKTRLRNPESKARQLFIE